MNCKVILCGYEVGKKVYFLPYNKNVMYINLRILMSMDKLQSSASIFKTERISRTFSYLHLSKS